MDNKDLEFNESLSQEFSKQDLNVLVWTNTKTHKHLYMKVGKKNKDSQIELIPLDENELRDLHLEESISETVNGSLFDMDIEESVSDSEPVQSITKFNSQDVDSMKQAKRMAEQQIAKLEGNSSDVTKEAVEHFQQEKENKAVELEALGIPCEANNIKTVKDLTRAETTIHKMRELKQEINAKTSQTVPQINAGCVPLSSQTPAKTQSEGYGSVPEMVQDVADRAALGDIQAKQIMQKLLHKSLKGVIDNRLILKPYEEPEKQTVESSEYGENLKLVVKPDVGNINDTFRRRQLKRRAAQGDQTAQAILDSHSY